MKDGMLNLLAKVQARHAAAVRACDRNYSWETHSALEASRARLEYLTSFMRTLEAKPPRTVPAPDPGKLVYGPFTVHIDPMAERMLGLIQRHPDGACLSLGMLPADIMQSFDVMLRQRIPDHYLDPDAERIEFLFREDGAWIRQQIIHKVTVAILQKATERGLCVV
jgi:hypothetical protein